MSPLIKNDYYSIIDNSIIDNNIIDNNFNLLYEVENNNTNINNLQNKQYGNYTLSKFMQYLALLAFTILIEIYLLHKFLPTIIKNIESEKSM